MDQVHHLEEPNPFISTPKRNREYLFKEPQRKRRSKRFFQKRMFSLSKRKEKKEIERKKERSILPKLSFWTRDQGSEKRSLPSNRRSLGLDVLGEKKTTKPYFYSPDFLTKREGEVHKNRSEKRKGKRKKSETQINQKRRVLFDRKEGGGKGILSGGERGKRGRGPAFRPCTKKTYFCTSGKEEGKGEGRGSNCEINSSG